MLLGDFKTLADWMTALIDHMEGFGTNWFGSFCSNEFGLEIVPKWQRGQMSKHHRVLPVLYTM